MFSITALLDQLDTLVEQFGNADIEGLDPGERYTVLERLETSRRRQFAVASDITHRLEQVEGWPAPHIVLADVLRITRSEARRRINDAAQLAPRTTLTGDPVTPVLPATSKAWHDGALDPEHLRTIQRFHRELPFDVDIADRERAERTLAENARDLRPDQLAKLADRLSLIVNPDGKFSDEDRARRRGFTWCGAQRPDGMSVGKLVATPELRAMLDAWLAKFAAPGMCNPDDQIATVSGEPSQEAIERDARGNHQRQHDAIAALLRGQLGDPKLGKHSGLPVTVIVSTTVEQLQARAGTAITAGGSVLPMPDLIRMASHAWHYLCVFDGHSERPLYLGRSKRIASADQRVVLHGKERGCTAPNCSMPGYLTEVHHRTEWAAGGLTDIDDLTLACGPHHRLITDGGWRTRRGRDGITEWLPPPGYPLAGGTNDYHHPERLLGL